MDVPKVVITGSSQGIGLATMKIFLDHGFDVHGIDVLPAPCIVKPENGSYFHHRADVSDITSLPELTNVKYLINNAGQQTPRNSIVHNSDVDVNLIGLINTTEKYGLQESIRCIVNISSVSAHNGAEFGPYAASKGGVLAYTKWTAQQIAKYGGRCNSLSFGGVLTDLNNSVTTDYHKWTEIMSVTPLKRWATPQECAEWAYFLCAVGKSMTGQDIIIDNGESSLTHFVW